MQRIEDFISEVRQQCILCIKAKVTKVTANVLEFLQKKFYEWFAKDDQGIPKLWSNEHNIEDCYLNSY